ncbi:glycoside hydrolase [Truncatella angustata]|uniref:Glycoside hydrolase n=1 Tax=Truncatella angustata TaxID=152316 RepID=A0A9P8ZZV8_9PEZI|nr:glycoside hydrolase [Truncatella angustata]KAH6655480.1 glycoside hydrolase [Truncatella angustata]
MPHKRAGGDRSVFAHYMVGITYGQSASQWATDISEAKSAGINGFALNVGSTDDYNSVQLPLAYAAAESAGDFSLFLSFDMGATTWTVDQVNDLINTYKGRSAQFKVNGVPFVSTFEGPNWSDNWASVRSATGGIFLVPDWSSLGPTGVQAKGSVIDGAFNWGAWPNSNSKTITTDGDTQYQTALGGKAYMMGVSPYFYTHLPPNKNWYSTSDTLWYDRWSQVLEILPDYVQLITWNDYGESSYLNSPVVSEIVPGANEYAEGVDHTAFRFVLPYFISAYKAGNANVALPSGEGAVAWYRTTSKSVCGDGDTVWGQGGTASAADGTDDVISVIALSNSPGADITVSVGGSSATVKASSTFGKASLYTTSFAGKTGDVTITVGGKTQTGPAISGSCPSSGHVNFNAVAVQIS